MRTVAQVQTVPPEVSRTKTLENCEPVLPLMVHDEMATVPPWTKTPPPIGAVFPVMVDDEMASVL